MAMPTTVNSQITDAITEADAVPQERSPSQALGSLYQSMSHATGLALQNAVASQQQTNNLFQAATAQGVNAIFAGSAQRENPTASRVSKEPDGLKTKAPGSSQKTPEKGAK